MKTLSEQIAELQKFIAELRDKLLAATKELEENPGDAAEGAVVELTAELEKSNARLESLQKAEKALGIKAAPVEPDAAQATGAPAIVRLGKSTDTDNLLGKMALVVYQSAIQTKSTAQVVAERFQGKHADTIAEFIKATVNPAMSNVAGWAQELTQIAYAQFIDALRAESILPKCIPAMKQHRFDGAASVYVPMRAGTGVDLSAAFRAEGAPIPVKRTTFTSLPLTPKNMGVIVTATAEMLRRSTIDLSGYFQQAIIADTAEALDTRFISNAAGTAIAPAGIRNSLPGGDTRAASGTGTIADINNDVKVMVNALAAAKMGGPNTKWLMSPNNALALGMAINATGALQFPSVTANGTLAGYPVVVSQLMPTDVVLLVDFEHLTNAFGSPNFEASTVATLHEDDAPVPISSAGTPNVVAAPVRSLFQTNSWALRMLMDADWAKLRSGGLVQELTAVAWK